MLIFTYHLTVAGLLVQYEYIAAVIRIKNASWICVLGRAMRAVSCGPGENAGTFSS